MQYKIPQNVQIEDKIVWPLTMKQLIICGAGGGLTYFVYLSLAKIYYIEIWIGPVTVLGLMTLAFAFLKIHGIPFLLYIMLVIEFSQKVQKRYWMRMWSTIKGIITASSINKKKQSKKEQIAEKTISSLSDVSRLLDRNTFEHVKDTMDWKIDAVSDDYLIHESFLGKKEGDIKAHKERLKKIAKGRKTPKEQEDENIIHMHQLKKGNIEVQLPFNK